MFIVPRPAGKCGCWTLEWRTSWWADGPMPAAGQLAQFLYGRALTPTTPAPSCCAVRWSTCAAMSTRSGMLLYELLCGARAYQLKAATSMGLLGRAAVAGDPAHQRAHRTGGGRGARGQRACAEARVARGSGRHHSQGAGCGAGRTLRQCGRDGGGSALELAGKPVSGTPVAHSEPECSADGCAPGRAHAG